MQAFVSVRLADGQARDLGHGDLIGRLWSAALHLDDGRISEAHAIVSLRGQELRLLGLRGRFVLDGVPVTEVTLEAGQRIELAPDLFLEVLRVVLPDRVLALEGPGLPRRVLGGTTSVLTRPTLRLVAGFDRAAPAQLWFTGADWRLRLGETSSPLEPGDAFQVDGLALRAVSVPVGDANAAATRTEEGWQQPLRVVARFDTVHVQRGSAPVVVLSGLSARILSELVAFDGPVAWEVVAREVWNDGADPAMLRRKWDVSLARLRRKLRDAGVRDDLVRSVGTGHVEVVRYPGDTFEDRT